MRPLSLRFALLGLIVSGIMSTWSCSSSSFASEANTALPKPVIDLPAGKPGETQTAILAGGCFWCEEGVFEQMKGVTSVVAGYAGGTAETATYELYHESNHAEAVKITYDPTQITYANLIRVLFTAGDPTVKDGQEPDYGHQYRMAIFYETPEQKRVAEAYIQQVTEAKIYRRPIVATVESMPHGFFPAEDYHQHFVTLHPDQPYVRQWSLGKIRHLRAALPDEIKPADQAPPNK